MGRTYVSRTTRWDAETWYFTEGFIKSYHMVGRTALGVKSLISQEQVDALVAEHGTYKEGKWFSITQQLDFIATEILRVDRRENVSLKHSERRDYFSVSQWWYRVRRESPFPDMDVIAAIRRDPNKRVKNYAERITGRPFDKKGNTYGAFTEDPKRVEE